MKATRTRVVITGASSGIGAATAIAFAREGSHLVLGARGMEGLEDIARRCREAGGRAEVRSVDVTDAAAVVAFAAEARSVLGEIDLWFSNVGIGVLGKYQDVPAADHRQVIEANLVGHMNDAHAVLPIFLEQDHGIWVNMISVGGFLATPYAAAYAASKYGLRGFSESLRGEMSKNPRIHVCDVYPTFVDTPGIHHAGNYMGAKLRYPPGPLKPETVAAAVVRLASQPRNMTVVGAPAIAVKLANFLTPNLNAAMMNGFLDYWSKRAERTGETTGALYDSSGVSGVRSGTRRDDPRSASTIAVGAVVALVALGLLTRGRRSSRQRRRY